MCYLFLCEIISGTNNYLSKWLDICYKFIIESMTRVEKMKQILRVHDEDADLSELTSLSNYLHEHIDVISFSGHHI